jgi:hypothetical protein
MFVPNYGSKLEEPVLSFAWNLSINGRLYCACTVQTLAQNLIASHLGYLTRQFR